ncbi:nuclease [Vibrio phage vB_VpP_1]|nr:nuclease [Vibrio phage vB_VpP_1]
MINCNKCKVDKDESEFYPRNKVCKECTKKRVAAYQKTEKGARVHREANKRYSQTEKGKATAKRNKEKYLQLPTTKKKQLAKWAVKRAVDVGILTRDVCEVCGSSTVHAHHDDYDKQLDVRWLCPKHHYEWHAENGEGKNAK